MDVLDSMMNLSVLPLVMTTLVSEACSVMVQLPSSEVEFGLGHEGIPFPDVQRRVI